MGEIKKLEKKIEADKSKLNKYKNQNLKRELREELWKEQKKIINAYIKTQKSNKKRLIIPI